MTRWIRRILGTEHLEAHMSQITDALNRLAEQTNAVSAAQATSFTNLQNAIIELRAGNLDPEQQEIVTRIEQSLTKLGEDAQRADDGYEPTTPDEPNPDVPGETVPDTGPSTDEDGDIITRRR